MSPFEQKRSQKVADKDREKIKIKKWQECETPTNPRDMRALEQRQRGVLRARLVEQGHVVKVTSVEAEPIARAF